MIENDTTGMDRSAGRIFVRDLTLGMRYEGWGVRISVLIPRTPSFFYMKAISTQLKANS